MNFCIHEWRRTVRALSHQFDHTLIGNGYDPEAIRTNYYQTFQELHNVKDKLKNIILNKIAYFPREDISIFFLEESLGGYIGKDYFEGYEVDHQFLVAYPAGESLSFEVYDIKNLHTEKPYAIKVETKWQVSDLLTNKFRIVSKLVTHYGYEPVLKYIS